MMRRLLITLAASAALFGCETDDPRPGAFGGDLTPVSSETDFFEKVEVLHVGPAGNTTVAELDARVVDLIDGARTEIVAAFATFESPNIAQALIEAHERGVTVLLAGDVDGQGQAGWRALAEAGVPATFGDGPLLWKPQPTLDVRRLGSQNRMTHNVVVADGLRMISVSGGFADPEATGAERWQLGVAAIGEILVGDWRHAIKQLTAGTFATTLTFFGAPTAADGDNRTSYPTEDGVVEGYMCPSEPVTKHLIDEIYGARASVWIASETMSNAEVVNALRYKAAAGFEVRVIVDPGAENEQYRFEQSEDVVRVGLVHVLRDAFEDADNASLVVKSGPTGTVAILDASPSPIDGRMHGGQAFVLSQPLSPTVAFANQTFRDDTSPGLPNDVFTDGNMLVIRENLSRPGTGDFGVTTEWFRTLSEAEQ